MKRIITLSIALVLGIVLVSLISSDSTANAAPPRIYTADTGVIPLAANKVLRLTIVGLGPGAGPHVRFGRFSYARADYCGDGLCTLTITSRTTSDPITLMPGDAASFDILVAGTYGRGVVESDSPNVRVNASIIDTVTGQVDAVLIGLLVP